MSTYGWGALNCPGDPGCNDPANWQQPAQGSVQAQINELWDAWNAIATPPVDTGDQLPMQPQTGGTSVTQFLNQNAGKIAIGAGLFFALAIFSGGRR